MLNDRLKKVRDSYEYELDFGMLSRLWDSG